MTPEGKAVLDAVVAWYDQGLSWLCHEDPSITAMWDAAKAYKEALPRIEAHEAAAARLAQDWNGGWRQ